MILTWSYHITMFVAWIPIHSHRGSINHHSSPLNQPHQPKKSKTPWTSILTLDYIGIYHHHHHHLPLPILGFTYTPKDLPHHHHHSSSSTSTHNYITSTNHHQRLLTLDFPYNLSSKIPMNQPVVKTRMVSIPGPSPKSPEIDPLETIPSQAGGFNGCFKHITNHQPGQTVG